MAASSNSIPAPASSAISFSAVASPPRVGSRRQWTVTPPSKSADTSGATEAQSLPQRCIGRAAGAEGGAVRRLEEALEHLAAPALAILLPAEVRDAELELRVVGRVLRPQ